MKEINNFLSVVLLCTAVLLFNSCQPTGQQPNAGATYLQSPETGVRTGGVRIIEVETPIGKYNVYTKRIGNNPKMKLLLLHGGPGGNHLFFESFESFLPEHEIEFYYYDQLGSYLSDKPTDSSLWTTERFVEEVEQVRKALGLNKDNFYILGHSWGGILAMEYALKYQQNLKGLIISNMMSSCIEYGKYANEVLAKQLPPDVLSQIREIEAKGDFDNPKYMELLMPNFYKKHVCRLEEWPFSLSRALDNINPDVYVIMQGPSEFGISGRLAKWERTADLPSIQVPTLVIGAQHDTMDPEFMKKMADMMPQGRSLICPNGSHCAMWDDQEHYFPGLIAFMKDVNAGVKIK
ncbi:proline iminopeptidase-family hydrolase [Rhodoflexus sp.]